MWMAFLLFGIFFGHREYSEVEEAVKGERTMELQTVTQKMNAIETVFEEFNECPVDSGFVLPEYLPDIAAVLKCILKPTVQTHQISGDRVMADGTVSLQVLYLDEERKCVHSVEMAQPFTTSFTVKDMDSGDRIHLTTKLNYVNCRATGPRRVDVHGAFSVKLTVKSCVEHTFLTDVQDAQLCMKESVATYSAPIVAAEKVFTINETLELNSSAAEMLLRNEAVVLIEDCKKMEGKAIVKGELLLKSVYIADLKSGAMDCCENRVPFSQIVDVDGLTEEDLCQCGATLLLYEVQPTLDAGGENKLLSLTAKICLTLQAYRTQRCRLITDAYHTHYPLKTTCKRFAPCHIDRISQDTVTVKHTVELPDTEITSVEDSWCDGLMVTCRAGETECVMEGQLSVGMIVRDLHGCLSYYERPVEFHLPFADSCLNMTADAQVLKLQINLTGTKAELQITLNVIRCCMTTENRLVITEMSADETAPYTRSEGMKNCCLKAYFAAAGESTWDIAKVQHIPAAELCAENHLDGEVLSEDTMLLIPLK